jgi:NAD(P)H-flavin reductase
MIDSAKADEAGTPPWWNGTVVAHERRSFDIAVLRVAPSRQLPFKPGQSVAMECEPRPRLWRQYSMANAPRRDGTLDFHVRMIDGGPVSMALVHHIGVGAKVRMGAPVGGIELDATSGRDILLIAGSTGLAPIKALLEQLATDTASPRRAHIFFGARTVDGLYDLAALEKFAAEFSWCRLTCCVSDEPDRVGAAEIGNLPDVVSRFGPWNNHDAYICGSPGMITATVDRLMQLGVPYEQIKIDNFGGG